jgi:hypothetical protein
MPVILAGGGALPSGPFNFGQLFVIALALFSGTALTLVFQSKRDAKVRLLAGLTASLLSLTAVFVTGLTTGWFPVNPSTRCAAYSELHL